MTTAELTKKNYDAGFWTTLHLDKLVAKGKLTQAEMEAITASKGDNE